MLFQYVCGLFSQYNSGLKNHIWRKHLKKVMAQTAQRQLLLSPPQYGIVLDAGSSHTALYIYEWPAEKDNNTGRVEQKYSCKVKGGVYEMYAQSSVQTPVSVTQIFIMPTFKYMQS